MHSHLVSDSVIHSAYISDIQEGAQDKYNKKINALGSHNSKGQAKKRTEPLYKVKTSLHKWPLLGPYRIEEHNQVWYCDNKKCKYTKHGKYAKYPIPNWRSEKKKMGYVLCDGCVREYPVLFFSVFWCVRVVEVLCALESLLAPLVWVSTYEGISRERKERHQRGSECHNGNSVSHTCKQRNVSPSHPLPHAIELSFSLSCLWCCLVFVDS